MSIVKVKKKWHVAILAALMLSAAGAFYYEGKPETAEASEEQQKQPVIESSNEEEIKNQPEADKSPETDSTTNEPAEITEKQQPEQNVQEEEMEIRGYTYFRLMDKEKYPKHAYKIEAAEAIGAEVFAIPYSDVYALVKDGKEIGAMTVGNIQTHPAYLDYTKEVLEFYNQTGLYHNLDVVLETGATVTVEADNGVYYEISLMEDGWISVQYR